MTQWVTRNFPNKQLKLFSDKQVFYASMLKVIVWQIVFANCMCVYVQQISNDKFLCFLAD